MLHRSALLVILALTALAAAASFLYSPHAAADEGPVALRAVSQYPSVPQGGIFVIAVEMAHKEHYHSWPAKEVKLPESIDEFSIRTEIGPAQDKDGKPILPSWVARILGTQYPKAAPGKVPDPSGGKDPVVVPLYSGKAVTYIRAVAQPDATLGDQVFTIRVYSQSCNEETCDMPREETLQVKVNVVKAGTTELGSPNEKSLFDGFDAAKTVLPMPPPVTPKPVPPPDKPTPVGITDSSAGGPSIFNIQLGNNLFVLAIASIIGGFILNLTPCVLPVIPIKVMSLTQHAKSRRHAIVLGLWMAAGVVAFWTVIGLPMAIISRNLDPSQFIFGIWWVCLGIGLLVALMGFGIMGLFSLNLPQSVYTFETKADSPLGSFFFGVLAAVLGLPCFGFMAGGLLAAAAYMPASAIMTIFVGLGVGMAAPYLVLSAWPQLLRFIPRTGPASELVKQIMGILLLAAAAFFVTAGIQVLLSEFPYLAGSMVWWAVGFFVAVASIWLIIRCWQITRSSTRRAMFTLLAFVMTAGIWFFAQNRLNTDRSNFIEKQQALADAKLSGHIGPGEAPPGIWLEYSPELLASVRASGRPVFLDFTASWCITCKALKAAILDPFKPEFKARGVVLMEVDCSARGGPGSKFLAELNRTGVPTWVLYGPASQAPQFVPVDKPSTATVRSALDSAGIASSATTSAAPTGVNADIGTSAGATPPPVPSAR